jgi:hypothetical protein
MDELFLSRCQIVFTGNAIKIFAPSELVAIALRRSKKELAQWAVQFRKEATEIFFPGDGGRPYKILGSFAQSVVKSPPVSKSLTSFLALALVLTLNRCES